MPFAPLPNTALQRTGYRLADLASGSMPEASGLSALAASARRPLKARSVGRQEAEITPEELLPTLGEVAAAFSGFGGIVAALGSRSVAEWSGPARFRFENLLVISVAAAVLSFLPAVAQHLFALGAAPWRLSSAILGLFVLAFLVVRIPHGLRVSRAHPGVIRLWMMVAFSVLMPGVLVLQASNLVGWPDGSGGGRYLTGVYGLLFVAGLQFIVLALDSRDSGKARPAA